MIEKIAKALEPFFSAADRAYGEPAKAARAAIEALMEPSDAMWRAASGESGYVTKEAWQAMLTTALNEENVDG